MTKANVKLVELGTKDMTNEPYTPVSQDANTKEKKYFIESATPSGGVLYLVLKRLFDIAFSLIVGLITLPLMLVIALFIKLGSPGDAIFAQERLGKNGKSFKILKFRTMIEGAEEDGPLWACDNDPRCTKVGRFLRKCRLDELPQMWNIFIGQMSVVGPRPEREYFYNEFETYISGFKNRLVVKPGLTGLAQVNGGYDLEPEEKIIYDMTYIKTRNLWLDFKIILKTVLVIFKKEGAK